MAFKFNPFTGNFDEVLSLSEIDRLTSITSNPGDTLVLTSDGSQLTITGTPNILNHEGALLWSGNTAGVGAYFFYDGASHTAQLYFVNPAAPSTDIYFWRYDTGTEYMTLQAGGGIGAPALLCNNMDLFVEGKAGGQKSITLGTTGVGANVSMIFRTASDQDLTWHNSNARFEFSDPVDVTGTMSATTVTGANVTTGADPGHTHTSNSTNGTARSMLLMGG